MVESRLCLMRTGAVATLAKASAIVAAEVSARPSIQRGTGMTSAIFTGEKTYLLDPP